MKRTKDVMNVKRIKRRRLEKAGIGIASLFFVFALVLGGLQLVSASNDPGTYSNDTFSYDAANITVTVNAKTIVDVSPEVMDFGLLDPGSVGKVYNVTDGQNNNIQLGQFEIENLGSTNIKHVWLNVTQPTQRPFGTGNYQLYDPGNWIAVNVSWVSHGSLPNNDSMSYVDRIEYNSSKPIIYLNLPNNYKSYGKLRFANHEYFWAINATGSTCDSSATGNTVMLVLSDPNNPHNVTQTGDIDLKNDDDNVYVTYSNTVTDGYDIPNSQTVYVNGEVYEFLVAADCSNIRIVKWNADAPGATTVLADEGYVYKDSVGLYPGDGIGMNIEMRVPYGVVAHAGYEGWLTVLASSY